MPLSNRTFGVEIECIMPLGWTKGKVATLLRSLGLAAYCASYGTPTASHWKVQPDSSTGHNGCEIVSPVLSGEEGIATVRRVAQALTTAGFAVNTKTGLHVHFGASDLNAKSIANLAKMYVWFETFFDHVMPKSRRATNNSYIKSNRNALGHGYGTDAVNAAMARIDQNAGSIHALMTTISPERYRKLNLRNLTNGKGTVEFRQHSGTVDPDKIENWIRLLDAFVAKALVTRIRPRRVERDLTPIEEMRQLFDMVAVDKPVRAFYLARRKEIARIEAAGQTVMAA